MSLFILKASNFFKMTNLTEFFHVMVSDYRLLKIKNSPQFPVQPRNGQHCMGESLHFLLPFNNFLLQTANKKNRINSKISCPQSPSFLVPRLYADCIVWYQLVHVYCIYYILLPIALFASFSWQRLGMENEGLWGHRISTPCF